jgi:catechol 2,3-dioxygenase-like lactoylglutathione lyase family enzyme
MVSRVSHTTVDCRDAYALSQWWKGVLGYTDVADDPNEPGDEECMILDPAAGHRLLFIEVPEAKSVKNRLHLDLVPTSGSRDEEVRRVEGLGASRVADRRRADGTGWIVFADPEGNEFCVLRSDAERVHDLGVCE